MFNKINKHIEECEYGDKCMKYGCKLYHKKRNKVDCVKGDECYNIDCNDLHSRKRNFKLFNNDLCYFGYNCNRKRLGTCNRFHYGIDKLPRTTYLLLEKMKLKEKKNQKQIQTVKETSTEIHTTHKHTTEQYIKGDIYSRIIDINLDFNYKNGNYTYFNQYF